MDGRIKKMIEHTLETEFPNQYTKGNTALMVEKIGKWVRISINSDEERKFTDDTECYSVTYDAEGTPMHVQILDFIKTAYFDEQVEEVEEMFIEFIDEYNESDDKDRMRNQLRKIGIDIDTLMQMQKILNEAIDNPIEKIWE